jgi:hypothetical protein
MVILLWKWTQIKYYKYEVLSFPHFNDFSFGKLVKSSLIRHSIFYGEIVSFVENIIY